MPSRAHSARFTLVGAPSEPCEPRVVGGMTHRPRGTLPGERISSMSDPDRVRLPSVSPITTEAPEVQMLLDRSDA